MGRLGGRALRALPVAHLEHIVEAKSTCRETSGGADADVVNRNQPAAVGEDRRSRDRRLEPGAVMIGRVVEADARVISPYSDSEVRAGRVLEKQTLGVDNVAIVVSGLEHQLAQDV